MTQPTKAGVYPDVPEHEYHSWNLESNSRLNHMAHPNEPGKMVPALYASALRQPFEGSAATVFGTAAHIAIPDEFIDIDSTFAESKYGSVCAAFLKEQQALGADADDRPVVLKGQLDRLKGLHHAFWNTPGEMNAWAKNLVRSATHKELSIAFEVGGELCKCRLDLVGEDYVADLKTTKKGSGSTREFQRNAYDRGYIRQGGWYLEGAKTIPDDKIRETFFFIVVESEAPYLVNVVYPDLPSLDLGFSQASMHLKAVQECREANSWPGYEVDVVDVIVTPEWARDKIENQVAIYLEGETETETERKST